MSSDTAGILIIIFFVVAGFLSGGKIFSNPTPIGTGGTTMGGYPYDDNGNYTKPSDGTVVSQKIGSISGEASGFSEYVRNYVANQYISIYKDKIRISDVQNPGSFDEYVTLDTNLNSNEKILISGWKLRSVVTGNEMGIGGAANIPVVGLHTEDPIVISQNSQIVIEQGNSPISTSFRINKCSGFFAQNYHFNPSLPFNCPAPINDAPPLSNSINNACLDYIKNNISRCQAPGVSDLPDRLTSNLTGDCRTFIETRINYESCVVNHRNDTDFFSNAWRIYTGHPKIIWRDKRDFIELLDSSGNVVDTYTY